MRMSKFANTSPPDRPNANDVLPPRCHAWLLPPARYRDHPGPIALIEDVVLPIGGLRGTPNLCAQVLVDPLGLLRPPVKNGKFLPLESNLLRMLSTRNPAGALPRRVCAVPAEDAFRCGVSNRVCFRHPFV